MKFRALLALGSALTTVMATPAAAQAEGEGASEAGDIIVTARRVEERLQDVPISITVFNQKTLTERNISDTQDLVTYTPALSTNSRFGSENATFSLRGFFQEAGTAPSVGVYFADVVAPRGFGQGIPAGDGAGPGSLFDLQNVQVLKGPQGTLFGRNTTGGAVLLVPQKPTDRLEGYIEGSHGNYDMNRIQAVLNAPLADTVRLRLGVDHMKRDGFLINDSGIGPRDYNDVNYVAFRASLVVDVTPDIENYTIFSMTHSENNGSLQKISDCNPVDAGLFPFMRQQACDTLAATEANGFYHTWATMPDPVSRLRQWQAINTTTWQANDNLTVKNIVSYARLKNKLNTPLYGTPQFVMPADFSIFGYPVNYSGAPYAFDFVQVRTTPGGLLADQSTFTEELQFQGTALDGALNWQAGGYFEDSRPKSLIGTQPVTFINCADPDNLVCNDATYGGLGSLVPNLAKTWFQSKALYAQGSYKVADSVTITGGIRYTWDKSRAFGQQYSYTFDPAGNLLGATCAWTAGTAPDGCVVTPHQKSKAPTWVIGVDYKPANNVMLYAKYSRGYRTGGVKTDVPVAYQTWSAEKVNTYEVGTKTSFNSFVRGSFNLAAYYNDFSNQQINYGYRDNPFVAGSIAPGAGPINVGKSRIWGIEADLELRPAQGLSLNASWAYVNTKVKEIVSPTLDPLTSPYLVDGQTAAGDQLPFTPKNKLTLGANYTLPLDKSIGDISLGATYSYTSSQIASYGLRDAATVAAYGKNMGILGSRNLVDLYLNWQSVAGGPVDLGLFATNVTKEKYYTAISGYGSIDPTNPGPGFNVSSVGQPRMYGIRARVNFGGN